MSDCSYLTLAVEDSIFKEFSLESRRKTTLNIMADTLIDNLNDLSCLGRGDCFKLLRHTLAYLQSSRILNLNASGAQLSAWIVDEDHPFHIRSS